MTNRILLVDNEDDNNIVFKMALEGGGFEVDIYIMILFWNYPILKMISMILSFLISIFQR
jgi:CheY-like chemotaxis protein